MVLSLIRPCLKNKSCTSFVHDWKRPLTPISRRPPCVLLKGKNESLPSSLALGLPLVFTKQQQTDRKRVFGCEFLELSELNKVLRESSASLSGVTTRFRSKPRSLRTTWVAPDLQVSCNFFRGPRRRFPCQECVLLCFSRRTESSIVGSVLQRTRSCV